jgi:hypothetical protein
MMRVDCGQLNPGAVNRPAPGEWHPRVPERLDEEELDWRAGRNAVYQLAALTIGAPRSRRRISRAKIGDRPTVPANYWPLVARSFFVAQRCRPTIHFADGR